MLFKLLVVTASASLLLTACNSSKIIEKDSVKVELSSSAMDTVLAGSWRTEQSMRDQYRHPAETLAFFDLAPGQNIVEISPGGGWYTNVLAPYSAATGGTYTAAGVNDAFKKNFSNQDIYGVINSADFNKDSKPFANGTADLVLTFRSVHGWVGRKFEQKAFNDFYTALKAGGILGVVEHSLPESVEGNMRGGYVSPAYTIELAKAAGFELVAESEVNANPNDTADHPFGVWTLPPVSSTAKRGEETAKDFDGAKYKAVGESDRYTMKFRKPM